MCGITGIFYKRRNDGPVGHAMVGMCDQLFRRGPDSAGVAVYGRPIDGLVVRVDLDRPDLDAAEGQVVVAIERATTLRAASRAGRSLRLEVASDADGKLADLIEEAVSGARVFSIGRAMEIVTMEMQMFARACGKNAVHDLEAEDVRALTIETSLITGIPLAGTDFTLRPDDIAAAVEARLGAGREGSRR